MITPTILHKMRKKNGLSQGFIAEKLGISRPSYVALEKGERELTLSQAEKLADVFDMSFERLICGDNKEVKVSLEEGKKPIRRFDTPHRRHSSGHEKKKEAEMRVSVPAEKVEKFKESLLYILGKVGGKPNVGMTVLYKLLYFIDFDYYEKYEEQLIGALYIKNHYGPTPVAFAKIVSQMEKEGAIEQVKSKYFEHEQTKYLPHKRADVSEFSAREIKHIDEVLERLSDKTATELSNLSHKDIPWIVAEEGRAINYESVFYRTEETSVRKYDENAV
jgi:transcriptional regulator with XRE-family HTH domain